MLRRLTLITGSAMSAGLPRGNVASSHGQLRRTVSRIDRRSPDFPWQSRPETLSQDPGMRSGEANRVNAGFVGESSPATTDRGSSRVKTDQMTGRLTDLWPWPGGFAQTLLASSTIGCLSCVHRPCDTAGLPASRSCIQARALRDGIDSPPRVRVTYPSATCTSTIHICRRSLVSKFNRIYNPVSQKSVFQEYGSGIPSTFLTVQRSPVHLPLKFRNQGDDLEIT